MNPFTKRLLLIFFALVIVKLVLSSFVPTISGYSDENSYAQIARNFFLYQKFTEPGMPSSQYPPLYPTLISISYIFRDMQYVYLFMKLLNALLSSLILFPAWLLAKEFLDEKSAFLAAVVISVMPSNFAFAPFIMSENLYYPLFLFSVFAIYKAVTLEGYKWAIIAGIFVSLSYLTKASGIALLLVGIGAYAFKACKNKEFKLNAKKSFVFVISSLALISLWLIRNGLLSGFSPDSLSGGYYTVEITNGLKLSTILIWFLIYSGYLIITSGFVYSLGALNLLKARAKYSDLLFISGLCIFVTLFIAANANGPGQASTYVKWLIGRPIGRYIEMVLPLIIIMGIIAFEKLPSKLNIKSIVITLSLLICSSFLYLFPLFPINNLSLSWLGILAELIKSVFNSPFISQLIFAAILILIGYILYKVIYPHTKRIIYFSIIFFILVSLLGYSITLYNTRVYWAAGPQIQIGMFMNKYDPQYSTYLLDVRDEATISKLNQSGIYEDDLRNVTSSIIGFWLNDKIIVGNPESYKGHVDYIYTKHPLSLNLIKQIGEFKMYSAKELSNINKKV